MKKSTIWLLAVIMALTFIGLLYVQIMYMENMIKMRNEQFTDAVKRSLYAVSTSLELDETQRYLDEYLEEEEKKSSQTVPVPKMLVNKHNEMKLEKER